MNHPFSYSANYCTESFTGAGPSTDGSTYAYTGANVTTTDGKVIAAPVNNQTSSGTNTDANGNVISNNGNGTFTDTLGKTALTITGSGTPASPRVFTYSTPTGTASVTVAYKNYTVQTYFQCSNVTEYNLSQNLVNTITLADGSVYQFGYEATPGHSSNVTGRLASLTLPQGGVIAYTYTGANNGIVCADGTPEGLTRAGAGTTTYVRSNIAASSSQTDVTDGLGNDTYYYFVMEGAPETFYETNRTVHQGSSSGPVLLTRQTCYDASAHPCLSTAISLPVTRIDTFDSLNGGGLRGSTVTYNSNNLATAKTDYDFGSTGSRGAILRQETWTYPTSGITGLLVSDTVTDGTSLFAQTTYAYDETTGTGHAPLSATSGLPQHVAVSGSRGNLTTVNQYPAQSGPLTTAATYEDTGNALVVTGPTGASSYGYDTTTHGFTILATPPTPSSGVSLPASATYDANSGLPLTAVDPNSQTVTYKTYDPLFRPTEIDYPDGGKMTASYTATQTGVYHYLNSSTHSNTQTNYDSYGRLNYVAVQNASGGYYYNNYCYDSDGNLNFAAYRFPSGTGLVCSGTGGDTYTYDALGRVLTLTHGDNSQVTYSYTNRASEVTDENGVSRIVQADGLGRPVKVCEISGKVLGSDSPAACGQDISGTGYVTNYAYATDTMHANAQEVKVTQGVQVRTFESDWLGRTTMVTQPESGTTSYTYAYSVTAGLGLTVTRVRPQANQTGSTQTTTTTQYDSIGRMVTVSYNDGLTPTRSFKYDTNTTWSQVGTNLKGRLAVTAGGSGSTLTGSSIGYDAMGRVVNLWSCAPSTCGTGYQGSRPLSFAYDWAGNLTQEADGVSGTINYGRSIAGEVTSITNATYTNVPYNPPNLVSSVVNGADGPVSYTLGNGLNVYRSYDGLGRYQGQWVCNGPAAVNCSGGTQIYGTKAQWNGSQMVAQADTVLNQQVNFGYTDGFNRLTARTVTAGTLQNYTYSYDRYGNRLTQTPLQGGYSFNPTINPANNQITTSGYTYDAAGNMTNDAVNAYTYDAEGNIVKVVSSSGTTQYVYDVFNQRIRVQGSSTTTEYAFDYAGRRISSWLAPNNTGSEGRIFWDGQQFGYRSNDGTTYYDHQDTLGTERMRTDFGAGSSSSYVSLPWGDGYTATVGLTGSDQDNNHFAELERDAESGTEHATFRNYASAQGRWLAPDSYMGSYDLNNPQSMNRYAYALNNPMTYLDPSGLAVCQKSPGNCNGQSSGGSGDSPAYVVDGIQVSQAEGLFYLSLLGGLQAQYSFDSVVPSNTPGIFLEANSDLITVDLDPFGSLSGAASSVNSFIDPTGGAPSSGTPDKRSCASRLAAGVQQNTGMTPTNIQYTGTVGGHADYSFDVSDPAGLQGIMNQNPPWPLPFGLDQGSRYGIVQSTHIETTVAGGFTGHTDLFNGHSFLAPLHWIVDVGIGHIPGVNLDFGCKAGS